MKILVVGAGATGGYYGGRLALAGRDVTFLVRERRAEKLRRTGLILRTPSGEASLMPKLISAAELKSAPPFDLILLSVKAYTFASALQDFAPAVGPQTMILPLLNGMRHLDALAARFGDAAVLGGLCRISSYLDDEGRIVQMAPLNQLAYGERDRTLTPRIQAVDTTMQGCGFDAVLSPDILAAMWVKWMLLASLGSINTLARGSIGQIEAIDALDGAGLRLENRVLEEAIAVATAHGYAPDAASKQMMRNRLTERGSPLESSMYRDLKSGNPVEADQIVGDLVARARAKSIETPLLEAAYVQLCLYEQTRTADTRQ